MKVDKFFIFFIIGVDKTILLWDIASGNMLAQLKGHTETVYALTFSREGSVLSSGKYNSNLM
jgi:WD40 repeat protein